MNSCALTLGTYLTSMIPSAKSKTIAIFPFTNMLLQVKKLHLVTCKL